MDMANPSTSYLSDALSSQGMGDLMHFDDHSYPSDVLSSQGMGDLMQSDGPSTSSQPSDVLSSQVQTDSRQFDDPSTSSQPSGVLSSQVQTDSYSTQTHRPLDDPCWDRLSLDEPTDTTNSTPKLPPTDPSSWYPSKINEVRSILYSNK